MTADKVLSFGIKTAQQRTSWGLPTVGTGATRSRETAETRGMRGKVI